MPNKKILIADDEEQTCLCVSMALKMEGYTTVVVNDGEKALQTIVDSRCTNAPVDLLVCDIQMPKLNGEELVDKMSKLDIAIPTVVITGFGEKDLVVRLMRKGCRDFIDKPFEPAIISERIAMIFSEEDKKALENKRVETMAQIGVHTLQYAHDINNIIGGTIGYADSALTSLEENHPSRRHITKLIKNASRAAEICDKLLSATPCTDIPVFVSTEVNCLVERAGALLRDIVSENVTIEIRTDPAPVWCSVNAERIQQALLNLGINAAQAMQEGGKCIMACSVSTDGNVDELHLTVSDNGPGIDPEIMNCIFEKNVTTKKNGHGMGLLTVKEIVGEHHGTIRVTSDKIGGTTFYMAFPMETN